MTQELAPPRGIDAIDRALARIVTGATCEAVTAVREIVDRAVVAGVAPLCAECEAAGTFPGQERARLLAVARDTAARGALLDRSLVKACRALAGAGIDVAAFKGAHLAHAVYRAPHLRPRADVDLLIRPGDRARAADALARAGFAPAVHVRGSIVLGQFHFEHGDAMGTRHSLDVHWRPFAPLVLASAISADEVLRNAATMTVEGADIAVPSPADALTLAVLHHAAHHADRWEVLWLLDVLLIVRSLPERERTRFLDRARSRRFSRIASAVLHATADLFDDGVTRTLAMEVGDGTIVEHSARLLRPRRTPWHDLLLDIRVAGWRERLTLLREHALPSADYMRASGARGWLPLAYARRVWRVVRWF